MSHTSQASARAMRDAVAQVVGLRAKNNRWRAVWRATKDQALRARVYAAYSSLLWKHMYSPDVEIGGPFSAFWSMIPKDDSFIGDSKPLRDDEPRIGFHGGGTPVTLPFFGRSASALVALCDAGFKDEP